MGNNNVEDFCNNGKHKYDNSRICTICKAYVCLVGNITTEQIEEIKKRIRERQILFRGYSNQLKTMIYGDFYMSNNNACIGEHTVKITTVSQYTGTEDANNKKIFEGDIVEQGEAFDDLGVEIELERGIVRYDEDTNRFVIKIYRKDLPYIGYSDFSNRSIKVIGNIYECPELLVG